MPEAGRFPKLACALESVLQLTAKRFGGTAPDWRSLAGELPIADMVAMRLEVFDVCAYGRLSFALQAGALFQQGGQALEDLFLLAVSQLVEQGFNPGARLRAFLAMQGVGHRPEMFAGMMEVEHVNGVGKTVLCHVPQPDRAVDHDVDFLGPSQAAA